MISKPTRFTLFAFVIASVLVLGCGTSDRETQTVRLLTHKEFQLPEEALKEFTEKTGIEVLVFLEEVWVLNFRLSKEYWKFYILCLQDILM